MTLIFKALISFLVILGASSDGWAASPGDWLASMPIQDAGRIKPYDTFARESLQLIHGRRSFNGKSANDVVMTWFLVPESWDGIEFIEVRHAGLREALKLAQDKIQYSPRQLMTNDRLPLVFQELRSIAERREKLNPYYQAVQRLENQLTLFQAIRNRLAIRILPIPNDPNHNWRPIAELEGEDKALWMGIEESLVKLVGATVSDKPEKSQLESELQVKLSNLQTRAISLDADYSTHLRKVAVEHQYNVIHPFQWAWVAYLFSAIFILLSVSGKPFWMKFGWLFLATGFGLHALGMIVRMYLAGRPPVSNMYETVVWVPWGAILFGLILTRLYGHKLTLICANLISVLCLILTDLAPSVLDGSIQPLEPVLRDNFWLATHVLVIVISYSAFFLAFALADVVLYYMLVDEQRYAKEIKDSLQVVYRSVQIGVILLSVGTILGGIWADYSWGRFWGWDPKETWALIAILGYVALLHARLAGLVKQFGMAAGSVLAFSLVIMAWYGVNFVLGAGLHSYGFGAGGVEYVAGFVAIHLLYVAYVAAVRYSRLKSKS